MDGGSSSDDKSSEGGYSSENSDFIGKAITRAKGRKV